MASNIFPHKQKEDYDIDESKPPSAKSGRTNKSRNEAAQKRFNQLKLIKSNIERDETRIEDQIEVDKVNIDLLKIKKYFKNVINDQNFLRNYENIKKGGNPKVLSAEDRNKHEKRKD